MYFIVITIGHPKTLHILIVRVIAVFSSLPVFISVNKIQRTEGTQN